MRDETWINVRDAGSLQAALDALPAGGGAVYLPAGTYVVDKTVETHLEERQHLFLVGDGRASVIVNSDENGGALLHIRGVEGSWWPDLRITVRDLAFVGNYQSGDALVVEFPNDTMIDGCAFFGHGGAAVRLEPQGTNVTVRDCWMRDCKRGVCAENIHHLTLHGNQTRSKNEGQEQHEHVYIGKHCFEIRIVNNHLAYGHHEGIVLEETHQHVIANNTIEGFKTGIDARGCRDIAISGNYLRCERAIRLSRQCNGFAVTGNICQQAPNGAIVIEDSEGAGAHAITGNVMRASTDRPRAKLGGVRLGNSERCLVTGNVIEEATTAPAISAGPGGGQHLIANNSITRCTGDPVVITDAADCMVRDNWLA